MNARRTPQAPGQIVPLGINLRHLRALSAVAAAGSISGAAENLFRVPSGVTRAITELEAALGGPCSIGGRVA